MIERFLLINVGGFDKAIDFLSGKAIALSLGYDVLPLLVAGFVSLISIS
jgi:hypothetical protein